MSDISAEISTISAAEASQNVVEFLCFSFDEKVRLITCETVT